MKILQYILLFISINSFAQEFTIKGKVTDSLKQPVVFANLMAEAQNVQLAPVFAMTDDNGNYQLHLLKKYAYKVKVLSMGYKPMVFQVDSLSNDIVKNIVLYEQQNQLEEVVITADMPVKIQGDSIVYKTDKFKTGEERKLKDVLKKLPGVEVDKNGGVTVMGKKVSKVLVEGKEFFGGGTKLAVENIPADAVDKVQAVNDYNSIGFMKGLTDEQKMIINIKLKEGKKHFVFGDLVAGGGNAKHYLAKANLFYYSPKTNLSYIGNLNNAGESPMDFQDFMRFEGGISDFGKMRSSFQNFKWVSGLLFPENFVSKQDKFNALQWQQDFGNKTEFSIYGIFSNQNMKTAQTDANTYLNNNTTEVRYTRQNQGTTNGIGKLHYRYKKSFRQYFDAEISGNFSRSNANENILSNYLSNENNIQNSTDNNSFSLRNDLMYHWKINSKNTIRLLNNVSYTKDNPLNNWQSTQAILNGLINLQNENPYQVKQNIENRQLLVNSEFKHYWIIDNHQHIYTSIGNHWNKTHFQSTTYQALQNGNLNNFASQGFNNDMLLLQNDFYTGIQYKVKIAKKVIVKPSLFAHYLFWDIRQVNHLKHNVFHLFPELKITREMSISKKIEFEYKMESKLLAVEKYLQNYYLSGFSSVVTGNPDLKDEIQHSVRFSWTNFSYFQGTQYYVRLSYKYKPNPIKSQVFYSGIDRFRKPVLLSQPEQSANIALFFKKSIKKIYLKIAPTYFYKKYTQNIQNQLNDVNSLTQMYSFATGTYFKKFPNFDLGADYTINRNNINGDDNLYQQIVPNLEISYDFLKGFIFEGKYRYHISIDNNENKNTYQTAEFSLHYQKDNYPWGFEISGKNLLNASFVERYSYNNFLISNTLIYKQPRLFMFKVFYKL